MEDFIEALLGKSVDPSLQLPDPTLVQYYHDFKNRTVWLIDEVNGELMDLVAAIIRWNQEDSNLPISKRKPIRILIMSPGGDLEMADMLISIIKMSKTPIYGVALGMVASAASLIYLSCHKRFALPNAYFILHRGSLANLSGNFNEIQAAMEDYYAQIERMEQFYIENTTYPEEVVKEKIKSDWYIHCDEALEYNIVTDVLDNLNILL